MHGDGWTSGFEPREGAGSRTKTHCSQQPKGRRSRRGDFVILVVRSMKLTFTVLPGDVCARVVPG